MDSKDQYIISLFQQYLIECGAEIHPATMRVSSLDNKRSKLFNIAYDRFILDLEKDGGILPLPNWLQHSMYANCCNILNNWEHHYRGKFTDNAKQYNVVVA